LPQHRLYGESSAAAVSSSEDFSHFCVGVASEAEREPGEVGHELIVRLRVHLVLDDVQAARNLSLEMLDPFFGEVGHVGWGYWLGEIDREKQASASKAPPNDGIVLDYQTVRSAIQRPQLFRRVVMKCSYRLITLLAATLTAVPLAAQSTQADERAAAAANSRTQMPVVIPAGTPLTVAIDEDLSSASVNQGQRVSFHLTSDYSEFGHVLISSGTTVRGTVAHVARRSAGGNPGTVTVQVTSVRAVDSTRIPLRGTAKVVGKNRQGQAAALGVLTLGIGATKKGLSAVIPAGTQFTVFTDVKRTIVVAR